jgi:hypothetical protein
MPSTTSVNGRVSAASSSEILTLTTTSNGVAVVASSTGATVGVNDEWFEGIQLATGAVRLAGPTSLVVGFPTCIGWFGSGCHTRRDT